MEDKKNIPYKKSSKNLHNSILEYYSPYPNENGKINTSE